MKISRKTLLTVAVAVATGQSARAAEYDWANTATDFDAKTSYTQGGTGTIAGSNVAYFKVAPTTQPALTASIAIGGLNFSAGGYDLTGSAFTLTLNGYGTSATGTTASTGPAIYSSSTGTNTFDVPVTFTSTSGTGAASTIYQTGAGSALVFNSAVSATTPVVINLVATGALTFNGDNSGIVAGITLTGTNVTGGAATLNVGSNTALGTGTFTFNGSNATLAASGDVRTIGNALVLRTDSVIGGTNNFTFTGATTASAASATTTARTLTISNTGTTTFSGPVYLSDVATTGRTLTINGAGAVTISGSISNFNGTGTAGAVTYAGTSSLTLSGNNTYSGGTNVNSGILTATTNTALGTGNVTVGAGAQLTLASTVVITNMTGTTLTLGGTTGILNLAATVPGTVQDTVSLFNVNGTNLAAGTYVSSANTVAIAAGDIGISQITGNGAITVTAVPEPATFFWVACGAGLLMLRFRRRKA